MCGEHGKSGLREQHSRGIWILVWDLHDLYGSADAS